jgi:ribosomal-protein-alanine N-acetyltransferase
MFGYRSNVPKVRLTTDRLVVRLVHERDAWRLADYYAENRQFLKPWEPVRDESHCYPSGWQARLGMITEFHKQGSAFYFALLDPDEKEIVGIANFSNVVRGSFHAWTRPFATITPVTAPIAAPAARAAATATSAGWLLQHRR